MKTNFSRFIAPALALLAASCGRELPELKVAEPPFADRGFEWARTLELPEGKYFSARGCAVSFSVVKNIARFSFSDTFKYFSEVDFFSGKSKLAIASCERLGESGAQIGFAGGGGVKISAKNSKLEFSSDAENLAVCFILPYANFADSRAAAGESSFLISPQSKKVSAEIKDKIIFCADTPESAFAIETPKGAKIVIDPKRTCAAVSISLGGGTFVLDAGRSRREKPGASASASFGKIGAVDFYKTERMELPDRRGKNLMQNPSFEMGFQYMSFRHFLMPPMNPRIWSEKPVTIREGGAFHGGKCLSIRSENPKNAYRQTITTASVALEKGDYVFSVWAKSNIAKGQKLRVALVNPAAPYDKKTWAMRDFDLGLEWKRLELPLKISAAQISPIYFEALSDAPAECLLDAMQLERGAKATEFEPPCAEVLLRTSSPDNFIKYGTKIGAGFRVMTEPSASGTVAARVEDFFGEAVFEKTFEFSADARGIAEIPLDLEKIDRGIFIVKTDAKLSDGRERRNIQRFMVADFLENKHARKNLFVDTYVDPISTQQFFPEVLERYRALGYGARAGYANTDNIISYKVREFGVDSLISYIGRTQKDKRYGHSMAFYSNTNWFSVPDLTYKKALLLDYWKRLPAGDITPDYLKKVERIAEEKSRKNDGVQVWGAFAEPEGTMMYFANPAFAKYSDFLKFVEIECAVARGVRKGNPAAKLSSSVTSTLARADRLEFFDKLLAETSKRGVKYDCVGAHIYRGAPEYPRPSLDENYQKLFEIMKKHGYGEADVYSPEGLHWLPISCYEIPFIDDYARAKNPLFGVLPYTYDIGHGERLAAALRARSWLVGLKYERIKCMNASNYGATEMDAMLTPYAYAKVPNTLGSLLGNSRFDSELALFPDTRCYVFVDGRNRPVAAIWACKKEFDRGLEKAPELFFAPPKGARLFDLMQAEKRVKAGGGGLFRLPLSPYPVFLVGAENSLPEFKAALSAAKGKSNAPIVPKIAVRLSTANSVSIETENPHICEMSGEISVRSTSRKFSIPRGGSAKFEFPFFEKVQAGKISTVPLKFALDISSPEKQRIALDRTFRAFGAPRTPGIKIDGDLSDWKSVPSVRLENMRRAAKLWKKGITPKPEQFSAEYKTAWDGDALCVAVTVRDDCVLRGAPSGSGELCDSVEIFMDTYADASDDPSALGVDSNDWRYKIWNSQEGAKVYRLAVPDAQLTFGIAAAKAHTFADDVEAAFGKIDGGYVLELRFSGRALMPFKAGENASMGFGIIVNDIDDGESPEPNARLTNSAALTNIEQDIASFPRAILLK